MYVRRGMCVCKERCVVHVKRGVYVSVVYVRCSV